MHPLRNLTPNLGSRFRGSARPLALAALGAAALSAPAWAPAAAEAEVKEFPQEVRHLQGLWANEHVPPYKCPASHPYLENRNYAPFGTTLIEGVSVNQEREPWPIGVSITGRQLDWDSDDPRGWATGISFLPRHTSATNWTFGDQWYQVVLHCTNDTREALT